MVASALGEVHVVGCEGSGDVEGLVAVDHQVLCLQVAAHHVGLCQQTGCGLLLGQIFALDVCDRVGGQVADAALAILAGAVEIQGVRSGAACIVGSHLASVCLGTIGYQHVVTVTLGSYDAEVVAQLAGYLGGDSE